MSADPFVKSTRAAQRAADALRAFGAHRAVEVLDVRSGELVLERLTPGAPLSDVATEDQAMRVVAALLGDGGWPAAAAAEPLADFARSLDARHPRFSRAAALLRALLADTVDAVLLHADLHYGNVLSSARARHGFLLVDPKGAAGEPAFDIGYLVSRPMPAARDSGPLARLFDRRLTFLPEALGLDRRRV